MKTIRDIEIAIKPEEEYLDISSSFRTCVENLINSFQELYLLYPEDQKLNLLYDEITKLIRPVISQFINPKYTENPVQQQLRHFSKLFPICVFYETQSQNPNSGETKTIETLLNELKEELENRFNQFKEAEFALDKVFKDFPEKIDIIRKRITAVEGAIKTAKPSRGNKINNDFIEYQILPLITDSNDDADTPQYYGRKRYETLQDPNADKICEAVEKVNKFLIFVNPLSYINMIDVLVKKAQSKVTPEQVNNYKAQLESAQSLQSAQSLESAPDEPITPKKSPEEDQEHKIEIERLRNEIEGLRLENGRLTKHIAKLDGDIASAIAIIQKDYSDIREDSITKVVLLYKEKKDEEISDLQSDIDSAIQRIRDEYKELKPEKVSEAVNLIITEKDNQISERQSEIDSAKSLLKVQLKDLPDNFTVSEGICQYQNNIEEEVRQLRDDWNDGIGLLKAKLQNQDLQTITQGITKYQEQVDSDIKQLEDNFSLTKQREMDVFNRTLIQLSSIQEAMRGQIHYLSDMNSGKKANKPKPNGTTQSRRVQPTKKPH